jgi:hypothetical protein
MKIVLAIYVLARAILAGMKELTVSEMASLGGKARAAKLSPEELSEQGRKAIQTRWSNAKKKSGAKKKAKK